jgi:hypothetical protein
VKRVAAKKNEPPGYATNLASEFHVLSVLHRLGANATMTLGNKKSVDIVVVRRQGSAITLDVKGVAGKWDWPADNIPRKAKAGHFLVLVSYEGKFEDTTAVPNVWVVPHTAVRHFIKQYSGRRNVSRARLLKLGRDYRNAWASILGRGDAR